MVESEAHVHERLGRCVVLVVVALEEHDGEVLHELEERVLRYLRFLYPLKQTTPSCANVRVIFACQFYRDVVRQRSSYSLIFRHDVQCDVVLPGR